MTLASGNPLFAASLFAERGISWTSQAHVQKVTDGHVPYEILDGKEREQYFDFAMFLPPFSGVGLKAYDRDGADITTRLFLPNDFMREPCQVLGPTPISTTAPLRT